MFFMVICCNCNIVGILYDPRVYEVLLNEFFRFQQFSMVRIIELEMSVRVMAVSCGQF